MISTLSSKVNMRTHYLGPGPLVRLLVDAPEDRAAVESELLEVSTGEPRRDESHFTVRELTDSMQPCRGRLTPREELDPPPSRSLEFYEEIEAIFDDLDEFVLVASQLIAISDLHDHSTCVPSRREFLRLPPRIWNSPAHVPFDLLLELLRCPFNGPHETMQLFELDRTVVEGDFRTQAAVHKPPVHLEPWMLRRDTEDDVLPLCEHPAHDVQRAVRVNRGPRLEKILDYFGRVDDHSGFPEHGPGDERAYATG